jgi:putative membrane protein
VRVAVGAWTLTAWDLFLDPQMVAEGHWVWAHPTPALPGVPGVPLTNYAGWLLVATVLTAALDRALPDGPGTAGPAAPALLLGWTWIGSAVGNLAFFGRPAVAGYGAVALGVTVLPYLLSLRTRPRHGSTA